MFLQIDTLICCSRKTPLWIQSKLRMSIPIHGQEDRSGLMSRRKSLTDSKPHPVNTAASTEVQNKRVLLQTTSAKAATKAADIASNVAVELAAKSPGASTCGGHRSRVASAIATANAFEATPTVPAPLRAASSTYTPSIQVEENEHQTAPAGGPRSPARPFEPFGAHAASISLQGPEPMEVHSSGAGAAPFLARTNCLCCM